MSHATHRLLGVAAALVLAACHPGRSRVSDAEVDAMTSPPRCLPPAGVSGAPTSIAEAVALVNSLPRPVTVGCFLQSLDRPLAANAAVSIFSLQPSVGRRSPRIFLFFPPVLPSVPDPVAGPLVMSLVPDGAGAHAVELGQMVSDTHSLKGELGFPVVDVVAPSVPFDRVRNGAQEPGTTICRGCHADEARFADIDYADAFASAAIRPLSRNQITIEALRSERRDCDSAVEPERCVFLAALFDHGDVLPREFPASLRTFTDQ